MRINAQFLLALFLLVLAFPGYGCSAKSCSNNSVLQTSETSVSFHQLLKRCLQSGINLVEEERGAEEEGDDAHSSMLCFVIYGQTSILGHRSLIEKYFSNSSPDLFKITLNCNYPPPDYI
jgi:hypothetical protein